MTLCEILIHLFGAKLLNASGAQILSSIHNNNLSAYLLSESSLFVWDDKIVMITCGETKLIKAVHTFLKKFPKEDILSLIFQRKMNIVPISNKRTSFLILTL